MTEEPKLYADITEEKFDEVELDPLDSQTDSDSSAEMVVFVDDNDKEINSLAASKEANRPAEEAEKDEPETNSDAAKLELKKCASFNISSVRALALNEQSHLEAAETDGPTEEAENDEPETDDGDTKLTVELGKLKDTASLSIPDVKEILAQIDLIEEIEKRREPLKLSRSSGKLIKPTITRAEPKESSPPDSETSDVRQMLIEMDILEGNELLKRGDRAGAISYFREAVKYAPNDAKVCIRLAEVLSEDDATKAEAEQLLAKAVELEPNNMELRSKLFDLREQQNRPKRRPSNPRKEIKAPQSATAQNGEQDSNAASGAESKTLPLKTNEQQARFISTEPSNLPTKIGLKTKLIIGGLLILSVLAVIFTLRSEPPKGRIKLLSPSNQGVVSQSHLKLRWAGTADLFIIQINENDQKIVERLTADKQYILTPKDCALLKPGHLYTWRVVPKNINGEELPYETDVFQFTVVSGP